MNEFLDYLLQFGTLNQRQQDLIASKATRVALPKDAYFMEAGHVSRQVGFVLEGVLRICYYNNKGSEITRYFIDERHLVMDTRGLEHHVAFSEYVQAVTDCQLLTFSHHDWRDLAHTIIGWNEIVQKIISRTLTQKLERIGPLVNQDAATRYQDFLEKHPQLANRVPLAYLASYLGMTQSSLSRIRKNIR